MDAAVFNEFQGIAYRQAGIVLNKGKESLVSARVAKRLRALELSGPSAYLEYLDRDESGEELVRFLDAISTNFTNFFRERDHFDLLSKAVREWFDAGQRRFRIWSAASSTGEEPYSIVLTIREALDPKAIDFRLLATDISTRVLQTARQGVYEESRLSSLTRRQRAMHLELVGRSRTGAPTYQVRSELRRSVSFSRLNLSQPPFPMSGPFDFVFCRNVMIYFDRTVRQGLVSEIERLLRPDGILVTGHSETLTGLTTGFRALRPSVYVKPGGRS